MICSRALRLNLYGPGVFLALAAATGMLPIFAQDSGNTATPAFGKAIQAAESAMNSGNMTAANRDLAAAEAQPGKNAYENFVIVQMRGALAAKSGDYAAALGSYIAQVNSGRLDSATALNLLARSQVLNLTKKTMRKQLRGRTATTSGAGRILSLGNANPGALPQQRLRHRFPDAASPDHR